MKFLVCNKWELEIQDKYLHLDYSGTKPYFRAVAKRPKDVAREAWCYEHLLLYISQIEASNPISVAEYFGGMGMNAIEIQNMLNVDYHATNDIDPRSCDHLTDTDMFDVVVTMDALILAGDDDFNCDLIAMDFHSCTALQLICNQQLRNAFDRVMSNEPSYIILTDSAVNKLHINKHVYAAALNTVVDDIHDYAVAFSNWLKDRYGYGIADGAYHRSASYFIIMPQHMLSDTLTMTKVPADADNYFRKIGD